VKRGGAAVVGLRACPREMLARANSHFFSSANHPAGNFFRGGVTAQSALELVEAIPNRSKRASFASPVISLLARKKIIIRPASP
jgi:hypothetical protein